MIPHPSQVLDGVTHETMTEDLSLESAVKTPVGAEVTVPAFTVATPELSLVPAELRAVQ